MIEVSYKKNERNSLTLLEKLSLSIKLNSTLLLFAISDKAPLTSGVVMITIFSISSAFDSSLRIPME